MQSYIFYFFFLILIILSVLLATFQNPVYNVLSLIAIFVVSAFFLLFNNIEFLSLILIMVYVGAVIVFFLFVTMILEFTKVTVFYISSYLKFLIISTIFLLLFYLKKFDIFDVSFVTIFFNFKFLSLSYLSETLYIYYIFVFIFSSILLLVSIIGCVMLSSHLITNRKTQSISDQQLKRYIYGTLILDENRPTIYDK